MGSASDKFEQQVEASQFSALEDVVTPGSLNPSGFKFYLLVDLDNGGGAHNHNEKATELKIVARKVTLQKVLAADNWGVACGVITEINSSQATIRFPCPGSFALPGETYGSNYESYWPFLFDVSVEKANLQRGVIATGGLLVTTEVKSGATLTDAKGNQTVPAVGDYILIAGNVGIALGGPAPMDSCLFAICTWYLAETAQE